MFTRIEFKGLRQSILFGYAAEVPFFKGRRQVDFKPGLNILFGPNGCGKSTLLKMLGDTMCATQGGVSAITEAAMRGTTEFKFARGSGPTRVLDSVGLKVHHDGQPVVYSDPRAPVGLVGGSFDQDFFKEGMLDVLKRRDASHGQLTASRMSVALDVLEGKVQLPKKPIVKFERKSVADIWKQAIDIAEARMAPSIEPGQFSVLLDEPEANFSLKWQRMLWAILADQKVLDSFQVIVASHSPFVLGLPHAHYIDLVPGYREEMQQMLTAHFSRTEE